MTEASVVDQILRLSVCVAGIWAAYIYQGVLQEDLSTKKFGPNGARFEHLTFLNWAQNVVCLVWSLIMLSLWSPKNTSEAPAWTFWLASISNTVGPACGIHALRYISFPAQVLTKSSKMIPVTLVRSIIYGVRYTVHEYLCTLLVAVGMTTFALFKSSKEFTSVAIPNVPYGYTLCFVNLGLDGFTNATQDSIKKRYPKTGGWQLMLGTNFWGSIYMTVMMFGWSKAAGYEAVQFCKEHPDAAWDILMFCVCGAIGQNFIFLTISRFGALTNTTITTTCKFVSILVSALWNGNPLSVKQWGGVIMVFTGLAYQIFSKCEKGRVAGGGRLKSKSNADGDFVPNGKALPVSKEEKSLVRGST